MIDAVAMLAEIERNPALQRRLNGTDWISPEVSVHYKELAWLIEEVKRLRHIHCECEYSEPCPVEGNYAALTGLHHDVRLELAETQARLASHHGGQSGCGVCGA